MTNYILDGTTPIAEPDLMKWAKWFETANRSVRKDRATIKVGDRNAGFVDVSTVFLGIDHRFNGDGPPIKKWIVAARGKQRKRCMRQCASA